MNLKLRYLISLLSVFVFIGCSGNGVVAPPTNGPDDRVPEYSLLIADKICHWNPASFPLKVYLGPPPPDAGGYGASMNQAAIEGIGTWNNVITGNPTAFVHEPDAGNADIVFLWETMSNGGVTYATEYSTNVIINNGALSDILRDPEAITLLMGHELGHVLGLGPSGVLYDLMFPTVTPGKTSISDRDREMINWLYSQETYLPISSE